MDAEHPTLLRGLREAVWSAAARCTVGAVGTRYLGPVVNRRAVVELEGLWRIVPAVYCVYRADTTLFHRRRPY